MRVSDSSLSHYASRQLTPPLLHPSFVMQVIASPTTHTLKALVAALIHYALKEEHITNTTLHLSSVEPFQVWATVDVFV